MAELGGIACASGRHWARKASQRPSAHINAGAVQVPLRRKAGCYAVSTAILLMAGGWAAAQDQQAATQPAQATAQPAQQAATQAQKTAPTQAAQKPADSVENDVRQVMVVGQRAAQQTAIDRKKNAETAMDSIVADDVGSFPDRNVAEAVSRIAGVSLERGDFGEGQTVSVRGNGPDLTRVEIDGMGVNSPGGTDLAGGGDGRGSELRELPADLIASVDVVKGATVDMTEGSLGGGIIIKTRTGLDFKKPLVSLRTSGQINSLNKKVQPNLNLIVADKFFNGRLGMVANLSRSDAYNEGHTMQFNQDTRYGYNRHIDFDGSPEKTVPLNAGVLDLSQPLATTPTATYPVNDGGERFASLTPAEIVQRGAAAQSKAECFRAFPLDDAGFNRVNAGTNRANAQSDRASALRSCLNQWNDYTPGNARYYTKTQQDNRLNGDLRFDFKVNDKLTVYAKYNRSNRDVTDTTNAVSFGNMSTDPGSANNGLPNYIETAGDLTRPWIRSSSADGMAQGLYVYPGYYGSKSVANSSFPGLYQGAVTNLVPGTVVVDGNHHVTEAVLSNGGFSNDMISQFMHTETQTQQYGGSWRSGGFKAQFMVGLVKGSFWRYGQRASVGYNYGPVRMFANPGGVWDFDFSRGQNPLAMQGEPTNYGNLTTTSAGGGLATSDLKLQLDGPRAGENKETNLKIDTTYSVDDRIPFLKMIKFGVSHRKYTSSAWSNNRNYEVTPAQNGAPAVVVPTLYVANYLTACQNTAQSLSSSGSPCAYGYTGNAVGQIRAGGFVVSQEDFRNIIMQALSRRTSPFFGGARNALESVPGWQSLDAARIYSQLGIPSPDVNCIKACMATDGLVYERPVTRSGDKVSSLYLSGSFGIDRFPFTTRALPFGWELEGNYGVRVVRSSTAGTGSMTFQAITTNADWNPVTNNDAVTTTVFTKNITINDAHTDYMPALNLAFWAVPDQVVLRYSRAKTIARPGASKLASGDITCYFDQRTWAGDNLAGLTDDEIEDSSCRGGGGVMGNAALKPQVNWNQNLSLEWYPNKDTQVSIAGFYQKGIIGAPRREAVNNVRPFADSDLKEINGYSLADVQYSYITWVNGPANKRKGFEFSLKQAFPFLPGLLRNTGIDLNYTKVRSENIEGQFYEFLTGEVLPPYNEYRYSWNSSLWYDDGKLQARLAYQYNTESFTRYQSQNAAGFPSNGVQPTAISLPLTPPLPAYRDAQGFLDAKIAYKFENGVEVFLEGRNLGNKSTTSSNGQYGQFSQGPALLETTYSGRRYLAGMTVRF